MKRIAYLVDKYYLDHEIYEEGQVVNIVKDIVGGDEIEKDTFYQLNFISHFGNLTVTISRPYVPGLLLGTGAGLNSVSRITVLESTVYIKITVPNKLIGSTVCVKIQYLAKHHTILISTC